MSRMSESGAHLSPLDLVLNGLASLRVRLILTYVFVTSISFGVLLALLMSPVERFMLRREEANLSSIATTLGSTIRDPWGFNERAWQDDQFWTQRRIGDLAPKVGARIRLLGPDGAVLADSNWPYHDWGEKTAWQQSCQRCPKVTNRPEVHLACLGQYGSKMRTDEGRANGAYAMYLAMPISRKNPKIGKRQVAFILYMNRPVDSVRRNLRELRQLLKLGLFAALLITIIASILLSSNLSSGLRTATEVAREFAAGQMNRRMRETGRDEVGQLGAAFNQMADALARHEQLRRNLLADVSHELRTPLTAIAGCADMLAEGALRDDPLAAERFLSTILRESARLQRLVNDILELSKLQAGVIAIPCTPIPLAPIIDDAVEIARLNARQEGVVIHWEPLALESVLVMGNEDRLAQALRNLLDNAWHHSPDNGVIQVKLDIADEEVSLHISDQGKGIPPEDLPMVFNRFYRSGSESSTVVGTGLGLAIVQEIVTAHGGRIGAVSQLGHGTTFSLHLKRAQAES